MFKKRKAILLIHGFVGGNYDYSSFPNELEVYKDFDVFTYTLPGHEKLIVSGVKYPAWLEESINQIEFLLKHNYKEIYVIGHSMGGVIASHLASIYPQIKKLVLVAPAFRYFYFKDGKINLTNIGNTIKNFPGLFKNMGTEKVIERISKTPITTMLEFAKLVSDHQHDIEKVSCPILIIRGLEDKVVPPESTEFVYNSVKSTSNTLINIKDVTHDCFKGKRNNEIKEIITTFLRSKPKNKKEIINL